MEVAADRLWVMLQEIRAPGPALDGAYDVLTELANNAWQHGSDCYVIAQTHTGELSNTPGLQLAIADFGAGFRTSLSSYRPETEVDAILKAFEEGVSATGDRLRGYGLNHVQRAIDRYEGSSLSIISHNGWVQRRRSEFDCRQGHDCAGVFIAAYFPFPFEGVT